MKRVYTLTALLIVAKIRINPNLQCKVHRGIFEQRKSIQQQKTSKFLLQLTTGRITYHVEQKKPLVGKYILYDSIIQIIKEAYPTLWLRT